MVKIERGFPEICLRTDKHTDRHKDRHGHRNTPLPYWEQSDETNLNVGFVMNIQQWRVTVVANCPLLLLLLLLLLLMRMLIVMV